MQTNFLFVGPKRSWKFNCISLYVLGTFAIILFMLLFGISIFQLFFYRTVVAKLQNAYENQSSTNEQLSDVIKDIEEKHLVLERQVDQKKFLLAVTKKPDSFKKEDETVLPAKEKELLQEIMELQNTLNAREGQIADLEAQNIQSHNTVLQLFQKIPLVKKQVLSQSTSGFVASIPSQAIIPIEVMVDQFQMTVKRNSIQVQFNIRNTGKNTQAGYVIVRALREDEIGDQIPFKRRETMRFVIRRFRPFSKSFKQNSTNPYVALRVIVWDISEKRLLEEQFVVD